MFKIFLWKDKVFRLKTHQAPERRDENRPCLETVQRDKGNTTDAKRPRNSKTHIPRVCSLETLTSPSLFFKKMTVSPILGEKTRKRISLGCQVERAGSDQHQVMYSGFLKNFRQEDDIDKTSFSERQMDS